jgi:hypothetical protein
MFIASTPLCCIFFYGVSYGNGFLVIGSWNGQGLWAQSKHWVRCYFQTAFAVLSFKESIFSVHEIQASSISHAFSFVLSLLCASHFFNDTKHHAHLACDIDATH